MESEEYAVACDTTVPSFSLTGETARESESSLVTHESTLGMQLENNAEIGLHLLAPSFQFSTDLRKELSLDVLASLGDTSSAEYGISLDNSSMDMASATTSDMELISRMSSLNMPLALEPVDPGALSTVETGTTMTDVEHSLGSATPDTQPVLNSSFLENVTLSVDFPSSSVAASTPRSSPAISLQACPASVAPPFDYADPVPSFVPSSLDKSARDRALVLDAPSEGLSFHVAEGIPEATSALAQISEPDLELFAAKYEELGSPGGLVGTEPVVEVLSWTFPPPVDKSTSSGALSPTSLLQETLSDDHSDRLCSKAVVLSTPVPSSDCGAMSHNSSLVDGVPTPLTEVPISGDKSPLETALVSLKTADAFEPMATSPINLPLANTVPSALEASLVEADLHPLADNASRFSKSAALNSDSTAPLSFICVGSSVVDSLSTPKPSDFLAVPLSSTSLGNKKTFVGTPRSLPSSLATILPPPAVHPPLPDAAQAPNEPALRLLKVVVDDSASSPSDKAFVQNGPSSSSLSLSSGVSLSDYFDGSRSPFRGRKSARKKKLAEVATDAKDSKGKGLSNVERNEDVEELERMLEVQKKMLEWQIDEVQRITSLQFQLTGINPLSEELVWEVVGVKGGGTKSRDALPPQALKALQEIFAVKDTLTKKEALDISISSGVSLTQVKEFFAAQRSLVRKLVQQAHDEAGRLNITNASEQSEENTVPNTISESEKDLGFDKLAGLESLEKLIEYMSVEKSFAGQAQLLQVILQTDSTALVLRRLLEKGALKILGGWLVEAALEEQSSVILHLLKVLDHLPLSIAVPHQMPPLLQNVNKLRFYHVLDVAAQARSLLTKWSKMFLPKTEVVKAASSPRSKPTTDNGPSPVISSKVPKRARDATTTPVSPGSKNKKTKAESGWQYDAIAVTAAAAPASPSLNGTNQGTPEHLPPTAPISKPRWLSTLQPSESAVAAVSVSRTRKRLASQSIGDNSNDRRKGIRLEDSYLGKTIQPGGLKSTKIAKTSRPLSTDDIYKAKKLERLLQEPVRKSRRTLPPSQSKSGDVVSQTSMSKSRSSPLVAHNDGAAIGSPQLGWSSASKDARKGSLADFSIQEEFETLKRTYTPSKQDLSESLQARTPTSSRERSTTPSSQDFSSLGAVAGDSGDGPLHVKGLVLAPGLDTGALSPSLGISVERPAQGRFNQMPVKIIDSMAEDPMQVDLQVSDEAGHTMGTPPYKPGVTVLESTERPVEMASSSMKSRASVLGDLQGLYASNQSSRVDFDESTLPSIAEKMNVVDMSAMDATGRILGQQLERNTDSSIRERTLIDFYASLRASMIRWRVPPEFQPDAQWNVAAGEDSKEREGQAGRVKREEEAYYPELSAIPDDPKDPWEEEPNYDDTLTLEILVDHGQQKAVLVGDHQADISTLSNFDMLTTGVHASVAPDVSANSNLNVPSKQTPKPIHDIMSKVPDVNGLDLVIQQVSENSGRTHDPDLLAILLRHPELVTQLTAGQTAGQAFTPSGVGKQDVFMQSQNALKPFINSGNNGTGISTPVGGIGHERLTASNNSKAVGIPPQPGRSVSTVDQTPSITSRAQESISMMPQPAIGQQQTMRFTPHGGVDNRMITPQMPAVAVRSVQDNPGRGQLRVPPPPPPLPMMQSVTNQVQQPPLPSQQNKHSTWPQPQVWAGVSRPVLNPPQSYPVHEQLHIRPQPIMTHNVRSSNYAGIIGIPQVEVGHGTAAVPLQDIHQGLRTWSNGSHGVPVHENTSLHAAQDNVAGRNARWPRPPVRPPDQQLRSGSREFVDVNGRQSNVVDSRPVWAQSDRSRPVQLPFQGGYGLQPPHPPQYPASQWQTQESLARVNQGGGVGLPFPHGRDLRPPQQQLWYNYMGPASKQMWRGP